LICGKLKLTVEITAILIGDGEFGYYFNKRCSQPISNTTVLIKCYTILKHQKVIQHRFV